MTVKTMLCAYCGETKDWPAAFPSMIYAECWQCFWDAHIEENHPLPRREQRRIRRAAERAASDLALADARSEHAAVMLVHKARESGRFVVTPNAEEPSND